jgi:hypothetical protein
LKQQIERAGENQPPQAKDLKPIRPRGTAGFGSTGR